MRILFISASQRLGGLILLLLTAHCLLLTASAQDYAKWVNPFIGIGGHGHTFPGATLPFGMVQLSPDTRIDNWDGSSGYHYSDSHLYGFSHTHLSGTGIPDGCDILITPKLDDSLSTSKMYPSKFSHASEKSEPGYYSVKLDDSSIVAELTATTRVGMHRYTLPTTSSSFVVDLNWRDRVLDSDIKVTGKGLEGFRESESWAKKQRVYFVLEFSKPIEYKVGLTSEAASEKREDGTQKKRALRSLVKFDTKPGEQILIKVAISYVSIEGARKNLETELPGWDFDKVRADAKAAWNKELSKIEVSGGTDEQTTNFYTALYHTMIHPNVFNDVDGKYRGHDGKVHQVRTPLLDRRGGRRFDGRGGGTPPEKESTTPSVPTKNVGAATPPIQEGSLRGGDHYTVFSLWDTFRAAHPLYTIIDERRTVDFINTFIRQYEQGGRLPVWELWGEETDTMIGYHSVSVIADAMAKGIEGFDYEKAYIAAKHSAELDHFGLAAYKKRGYISGEDENESVSKTLEYAYNDYCIATMALGLIRENLKDTSKAGRERHDRLEKDASEFFTRSLYYRNLFDPETKFFRPKRNGGFLEPFQPNEVTFHFTEGNSWQYSFFVPHDVNALAELYGGKIEFAKKLDLLFTTEEKLAGREQPDITGLIGQYAHGNEPSHHMAYLYNYANQPWKTQSYIRRILDEFYKNAPDGLIGNEDAGQMSAWYVMSALGFYQVNPSRAVYDVGTPIFPLAKIHLENGKTVTINAVNASATNPYIASLKLNGQPYKSTQFKHADLMAGATFEFTMSEKPVTDWFTDFSHSEVGGAFVAVPIINGDRTFRTETSVSMTPAAADSTILYSTDGSEPVNKYSGPFSINRTTAVKAVSVDEKGRRSKLVEALFAKRPNDWTVKLVSTYNSQYPGGSDDAIIDGLRGNTNFAAGEWQGFHGKTFEAIIDLQRETEITNVGGSFLQSARSWIWMPVNFKFEISNNGSDWSEIADIKTDVPQTEMNPVVKEFRKNISATKGRYVRVRAHNFGKIPAWHLGAGGEPWIFVDEIFVETATTKRP